MRQQYGLTLIELMVTVAIIAILASLAVPSFRDLYLRRSVTATADTFVSDLRYARSEALKRMTPVTICQANAEATGCSILAGDWKNGWLVFIDASGNGVFDATDDQLIRVQQGFPAIESMQSSNPTSDLRRFTFQATGSAKAASASLFITPQGASGLSNRRLVCISNQGRPSLRVSGSTVCT